MGNSLTSFEKKGDIVDIDFSCMMIAISEKGILLTDIQKDKIREAYTLVKSLCAGKKRKNGSDEFSHILDVIYILLDEFDVVTYEEILIALLHDTIEDNLFIGDEPSIFVLEKSFGKDIVEKVLQMTKKHRMQYIGQLSSSGDGLTQDEKILTANISSTISNILSHSKGNSPELNDFTSYDSYLFLRISQIFKRNISHSLKGKLKVLRNNDYFSGVDELFHTVLMVKIADRLSSLKTLAGFGDTERRLSKLEETKKFFCTSFFRDNFLKQYLSLTTLVKIEEMILEVDDVLSKTAYIGIEE